MTPDHVTVKALLDRLVELATEITALSVQMSILQLKVEQLEARQSIVRQDIYQRPYGDA